MEKTQQRYSEALKVSVVREVLAGKINKDEARRRYRIKGKALILSWIRNFDQYGVCSLNLKTKQERELMSKKSEQEKINSENQKLNERIAELEQKLADEKLLKEMYHRMIEIAEQDLKIPIRKKYNTK